MEKRILVLVLMLGLVPSAKPADSVRDELVSSVLALTEASGFSWSTTIAVPEGTRFAPGPSTGRLVKGGPLFATTSRGANVTEIIKIGEKAALTDQNGDWQTLEEIEQGGGFGRFTATTVRALRPPPEEAMDLINGLETITREGTRYSGVLSEKAAVELAEASSGFRRRGSSNVLFAKAAVSFSVDQGVLSRMVQTLDASLDFNGSEFIVERVTTTIFEDVGSTTVEIPGGALAKLNELEKPPAATAP